MSRSAQAASARALRFKTLASEPGGIAATLKRPKAVAAAHAGIRRLANEALDDLSTRIARLTHPSGLEIAPLYADAHDIRAIAGTFEFAAVGSIADATCRYLEGFLVQQLPNRVVIDVMAHAMKVCLSDPSAPLTANIVESCQRLAKQT